MTRGRAVAAAAVAIAALAVWAAVGRGPSRQVVASPTPDVPEVCREDPASLLTGEMAVEEASEQGREDASSVTADLGERTSSGEKVCAWVVTYHDVESRVDGTCRIGNWEVVVHARTGEVLTAGFQGGLRECAQP